jgi:hypothetical protein
MADISSLTNALGTELSSSINNLVNIDPTKGVSEQLYLQQSKNILDTQKNMALEEVYSKGQAADYQKSQSDAYLAKQKQMYDDTKEKTQKLEEQQNWDYPEFHPSQTNLQELATTFSLVGILGTMLGGGGRNAGMNALSSMTGMMEGWKKGEKDKFVQEKSVFDENVKVMERKNNALQKRIEQIAKDFTTNREAAKDEYAILLAENPYMKKVDAIAGLKGVISAAAETNKGMLNLLEFKEKQRERAEARAGRNVASYQYVEKDGKVYAVNTKDPNDIREVDPKLAGATKFGGAAGKGGGTAATAQGVLQQDVLNAKFNLTTLGEDAKRNKLLPGGSFAFANSFKGDLSADILRYATTQTIDKDLQGIDAVLLNTAYDIASAQTGGRGQLSDTKVRAVVAQMPLDSEPESTKRRKWNALLERLDNANATLPKEKQVDTSAIRKSFGVYLEQPVPTQADKDRAKSNPKSRQNFIDHFGVNPDE